MIDHAGDLSNNAALAKLNAMIEGDALYVLAKTFQKAFNVWNAVLKTKAKKAHRREP